MGALSQSQRNAIDAGAREVERLGAVARTALLAFSALAWLVGTVLVLWLMRRITRPIALVSTTAIQDAARLIGEITSATQAQNQDLGQINAAVSKLDQMTQQNSALVEESAAASDSLKHQAQDLATLLSRFVLPGHSPASGEDAAPHSVLPPERQQRLLTAA